MKVAIIKLQFKLTWICKIKFDNRDTERVNKSIIEG